MATVLNRRLAWVTVLALSAVFVVPFTILLCFWPHQPSQFWLFFGKLWIVGTMVSWLLLMLATVSTGRLGRAKSWPAAAPEELGAHRRAAEEQVFNLLASHWRRAQERGRIGRWLLGPVPSALQIAERTAADWHSLLCDGEFGRAWHIDEQGLREISTSELRSQISAEESLRVWECHIHVAPDRRDVLVNLLHDKHKLTRWVYHAKIK